MADWNSGITSQLEADMKKAFENFEKVVVKSLSEASPKYDKQNAYFYSAVFREVTEIMGKYKPVRPLADKYKDKYNLPINYIV
jgi:hypothetical protein